MIRLTPWLLMVYSLSMLPLSLVSTVLKYFLSGHMHTYAPMLTIFFGSMLLSVLTLSPCTGTKL